MKHCVRITSKDNVATLLIDLRKGDVMTLENGEALQAREDIPYGHKIALEAISKGMPIIKYNETIGVAQEDIYTGDWVHIHNCAPIRGGERE